MSGLLRTVLALLVAGCVAFRSEGEELDGKETFREIESIAEFDVPLDDQGNLTADDRNRFLYALSSGDTTADKLKALVALWFDGGTENLDSITLAWWSSGESESSLRVLAMSVHNLRWEPTSAKLPFMSWAKRFDEPEESLRKAEYQLLTARAKEIASLLNRIALREAGGKHLDVLKRRLQAVSEGGIGRL
jgi:hypothetical protein